MVNPAFQLNAMPHGARLAWGGGSPKSHAPLFQASGAVLAVLAIILAGAAVATWPQDGDLGSYALACALGGLGMLHLANRLERRWATGQGLLDSATGLYTRSGLGWAGEDLLLQARREGRPLTLLVFDFSDLQEVRNIYGRAISRSLRKRVVRKVRTIAGMQGLAARTGKTQFTVLLAGVGGKRAQEMVQRVLGKPSRIELDAGDSEIVLVPDILGETVAASRIATVDELYREVAQDLAEMRERELRRRLYLQRERERHSRPMSLPSRL